ncbi:hypothetical protein BSL78_15008 [Apostichopus japonicus]|uniref:Uncharacterized protein n=1 Tax=Stichopus japonicus TaxID=307972 RepID=A0A2G8KJF3_STIJA|nr:hypothetical protein BSL78_15008 [Apostichopus japonicus]
MDTNQELRNDIEKHRAEVKQFEKIDSTTSKNMAGNIVNGGETEQTTGEDGGDWETRLSGNITWIRNEIHELKKQDKSLTRQFIELRSVIHHLRRYGFINRLPSYTQDLNSNQFDEMVAGSPQLSPKKPISSWYQTLPAKKNARHPRGPGEPQASPPTHFFNEDSDGSECDSVEENPAFDTLEYRGRTLSVLTPTCIKSPGPAELLAMRTRNMSFTSGATEDEYDC